MPRPDRLRTWSVERARSREQGAGSRRWKRWSVIHGRDTRAGCRPWSSGRWVGTPVTARMVAGSPGGGKDFGWEVRDQRAEAEIEISAIRNTNRRKRVGILRLTLPPSPELRRGKQDDKMWRGIEREHKQEDEGPNVYNCVSLSERQAGALALQRDFRSSILSYPCSMLYAPQDHVMRRSSWSCCKWGWVGRTRILKP